MNSKYEHAILRSLRRITRAIDLYSRQLAGTCGLTGPQLVCLRVIDSTGPMTPSALAREVDLSQATVTGIIDRLEAHDLVTRQRNSDDRRRVTVSLTDAGRAMIARAPSPLHDRFSARLAKLGEQDQFEIHSTLERVVKMMGADQLDAAPMLSTGPVDVTAEQLRKLLDGESMTGPESARADQRSPEPPE